VASATGLDHSIWNQPGGRQKQSFCRPPGFDLRTLIFFDRDAELRNKQGLTWSANPTPYTDAVRQVALDAVRIAEERLFDDLQSMESLPPSVRDRQDEWNRATKLDEKPNLEADWNRDGEVSRAERAWFWQKQQWREHWIGYSKAAATPSIGGGQL
jgi:hypothetical protein